MICFYVLNITVCYSLLQFAYLFYEKKITNCYSLWKQM
ncbi:hypothetical protein BACIH_0479 [Bacillus amyloliquefaciens]|nr:hypothetical protein BACIH_0479 [Bacillus amyloliquefaciens]